MASEAQVIANRHNASKSTGPKTEAGKARSSGNALTHGLSAKMPSEDILINDVYLHRLDEFTEEIQPDSASRRMALSMAVGASIRADLCLELAHQESRRMKRNAARAWDQTRRLEASKLIGRIHRNPQEIAATLEESKAGCLLLIDHWQRLKSMAKFLGQWKEDHISIAFDLLGVPKNLREGESEVIPMNGDAVGIEQQNLADREIARLEAAIVEWVADADEESRLTYLNEPVNGESPVILRLMRYHSEATRRYEVLLAIAKNEPPPTRSRVTRPQEIVEPAPEIVEEPRDEATEPEAESEPIAVQRVSPLGALREEVVALLRQCRENRLNYQDQIAFLKANLGVKFQPIVKFLGQAGPQLIVDDPELATFLVPPVH